MSPCTGHSAAAVLTSVACLASVASFLWLMDVPWMQMIHLALALVRVFTADPQVSTQLSPVSADHSSSLLCTLHPSCSSSHASHPLGLCSVFKISLYLWSWQHRMGPEGTEELLGFPLGSLLSPWIENVMDLRRAQGKWAWDPQVRCGLHRRALAKEEGSL